MTSGADDAVAAHELDLVTSAAKGDEAAFDRFFERNAAAAQLLVERLLGPGPAADGVVVEAFEKTVRRLPLLGARNSSPRLYVLSTARNGAYAALGRDRPAAPEGALAALLSLPSRQRELLALREIGLTEAECAEVAGIEPADVGVQLVRARLRLTDAIEGVSLSSVFADDRAERLLAAEAIREEGASLPAELESEITAHADEDERFAAALSAVRSTARSIGQLPPVSGAARLAAAARSGAVTAAARPKPPAAAAPARGTLDPPPSVVAPPPPAPPASQDPFDDEIGDEMAWGIIDDDEPTASPPVRPREPQVEQPSEGQWEDGAGALSDDPDTELTPRAPAPLPPVVPPTGPSDPALADPFAGWDDALDWADDDEKEWEAGQPPTEVSPAGEMLSDPGETRAFDAVAAGLVDPDPVEPRAAARTQAKGTGEEPPQEPRRGRRWAWLAWILGAVLLFAGVAFAAKTIQDARQAPERPAESTLDSTTKSSPADAKPTTPAKKKSSSSSSSSGADKPASTSGGGSSSGSSSGGSGGGGTGSTGSSGGSSSSGTSTGSTGSTGGTPTKPSTAGTTSGTTKKPDTAAPTVEGGPTSSGGSVRGEDDSATTP